MARLHRRSPNLPRRRPPPSPVVSGSDLNSPAAAAKSVHLLLRSRDLRPAIDLLSSLPPDKFPDHAFNAVIRRLADEGYIRSAIRLFRRIPSPTVFSYNSVIAALLRRGRVRDAGNMFDEMLQTSARPDVCTFNTIIRGFCLNSMVDEAFRVFHEMPRHGCEPDIITYNTIIDGLCRAGKVDIAHNLLNGLRNRRTDVRPNVVSYTTVIRGYCAKLRSDEALGLFNEIIENGLEATKITVNTLIQGFCQAKRMDLVKSLMERVNAGGKDLMFRPDTCTFNTIIAAHCNMASVDNALEVFNSMTELRVKPDSATYSIIIRALCESRNFVKAEGLVDELLDKKILVKKRGCVALVAAYNPVFEYLCQNSKSEKARMVLQQLLGQRAKLDIAAFKTVILGHCREGLLEEGYELLESMVKKDLKPDMEIFQTLIDSFLHRGKMVFALNSLRKMLNIGHRPSTNTFHLVLEGLLKKDNYAEQAFELVSLMLERKIRQNIDLTTWVADSLFQKGLTDKAFQIVSMLHDNGYNVKMEKLVLSLCTSKMFLEAQNILLFSLEKQHNLSTEVFEPVINGLCASDKIYEAFVLFFKRTEQGSMPSSSCLGTLKLALEKIGKSKESQFVATRAKTRTENLK